MLCKFISIEGYLNKWRQKFAVNVILKKIFRNYYLRKDTNKYRNDCKVCVINKSREYREKNLDRLIIKSREYRERTKDIKRLYDIEYRQHNRDKINSYKK